MIAKSSGLPKPFCWKRRTIELLITAHPADEVGAALLAQAREKLPEPELGTGGELIQQRGASGYLYNTLDHGFYRC